MLMACMKPVACLPDIIDRLKPCTMGMRRWTLKNKSAFIEFEMQLPTELRLRVFASVS